MGMSNNSPTKESSRDPVSGKTNVDWEKSRAQWEGKYEVRDAFKGIEAHREEVVKGIAFTGRQVAWSGDGKWCVVCGSSGVVAVWKMSV